MPKKAEEKIVEKKPAAEKPVAEKPAEKKAVEKKPAAKKAEPKITAVVQVGGMEFDIADITAKAYKAYKDEHKRKAVKEFTVYVKPEENVAYYTVNGEGSDDFKIEL